MLTEDNRIRILKLFFEGSNVRLHLREVARRTELSATGAMKILGEIMRECVHGLMAANGYKPYSHEATVAFLDEHYRSYFGEKLVEAFNRFRIIRNNIMYRANFIRDYRKITYRNLYYPSHHI